MISPLGRGLFPIQAAPLASVQAMALGYLQGPVGSR
jgi:hypothetical protein